MADEQPAFMTLARAIAAGDEAVASELLERAPELSVRAELIGATRESARDFYLNEIAHHIYRGDSALHVAAAGHRRTIARTLIAAGADVRARNRRGAEPLHYAADGVPGSAGWRPDAQASTIIYLIGAGADPNATDDSQVTPLHRAVRTRCAAAVQALLDGGADPHRTNRNGSTPIMLAGRTTGRGGSGSAEAKNQQLQIIRLLESRRR